MEPTQRRICFDIETADILAEDESMEEHGAFSIACAVALFSDDSLRQWGRQIPGFYESTTFTPEIAFDVLVTLQCAQHLGARIFAWNGLGFDLRWLGVAADDVELAATIALDLYDPMFQFYVMRGFPVSLAKVAEGMGIAETKLMDGADAPREWAAGNHLKVLNYCAGDCRITDQVVQAIEQKGAVIWKTQRGKISTQPMTKLLQVRDLLDAPEVDTSWMDEPIPRSKFTGWLPKEMLP